MSTAAQVAQLKATGNTLFGKGKYAAAADLYTEALVIGADTSLKTVLLLNRALCHRRLEKWEAVQEGCNTVLQADAESVKAHYYIGLAYAHQKPPCLQLARNHLEKALHFAREQGDTIKDDIWRELARVQYSLWEQESAERMAKYDCLRMRLERLLTRDDAATRDDMGMVQEVFDAAHRQDQEGEVDSCFMCPLTMSVYRDPVTCPSGMTYERSVLLEHLAKVGEFDPVTRTPLEASQIVPNVALRSALQVYLKEHPWAWSECW